MSMMRLVLAATLLIGLSAGFVHASDPAKPVPGQADLSVLLDTIRTNRKALVKVNLELTAEQSEAFWPIYERYQAELNPIADRMATLIDDYIANYRTLTNEHALQLIEDYNAAESDRLKVRRAYIDEFAKVLPGRTVARFYQIENKMDAVLRYELAATIPVVEEAPAAAAAK